MKFHDAGEYVVGWRLVLVYLVVLTGCLITAAVWSGGYLPDTHGQMARSDPIALFVLSVLIIGLFVGLVYRLRFPVAKLGRGAELAGLRQKTLALDMATDGIGICNAHGNYTYINHAHAAVLGCKCRDQEIGRHLTDFFDQMEIARFDTEIMPAVIATGAWGGEVRLRRLDGIPMLQELNLTALPDGSLMCVMRDISGRKAAEKQRQRSLDQMHQSRQMDTISRLAGGIAHDFNNILASILGYSTMLVHDLPPDSEQRHFAKCIRESGQRATDLVAQIQAFSKSSGPVSELSVDVISVVQNTIGLLRADLPPAISVDLDIETPVTLRPRVRMNAADLGQICLSLGLNALQALNNTEGRVYCNVRLLQADPLASYFPADVKGGGFAGISVIECPNSAGGMMLSGKLEHGSWFNQAYILIEMTDNGRAMGVDVLRCILEPFYAASPAGTDPRLKGLRLSVAHGMTINADGLMRIETRPNFGSSFGVLIPLDTQDSNQSNCCITGFDDVDAAG